jgi:hypothetical protein
MNKKKINYFNRFSPIPKHLTPEEREIWEEEYERELQDRARRRKAGFYDENPKKKRIGWRTIRNLFKKGKL